MFLIHLISDVVYKVISLVMEYNVYSMCNISFNSWFKNKTWKRLLTSVKKNMLFNYKDLRWLVKPSDEQLDWHYWVNNYLLLYLSNIYKCKCLIYFGWWEKTIYNLFSSMINSYSMSSLQPSKSNRTLGNLARLGWINSPNSIFNKHQ